jgi:hypothetical protein
MGISDTLYNSINEIDDNLNSGMYNDENGNMPEDILHVRNEMFKLCLDMWYPDEIVVDNERGRKLKAWKEKLMKNPSPSVSPDWASCIHGR